MTAGGEHTRVCGRDERCCTLLQLEGRILTSTLRPLMVVVATCAAKQAEFDGRRRELESRARCLSHVVASAVRSLLQQ
eukprot:12024-Eustigmatos_ZCMA.PRE.1